MFAILLLLVESMTEF